MANSIERVQLTVGDAIYPLAPMEAVREIEAQVLGATRAGGGFLRVTTDGGQRLSIYITQNSSITIVSDTVRIDTGSADSESPAKDRGQDDIYFDGETIWDGF